MRIFWFGLGLMGMALCFKAGAQEVIPYPTDVQYEYPFLRAGKASNNYYGPRAPRDAFFQKLESYSICGEEKIYVTHFGGSHVQAGTLSWQLRNNFCSLHPDASGAPGFLFPFNLARTNNPSYYYADSEANFDRNRAALKSDTGRWGMSTIRMTTTDTSGSIRIYNRAEDSTYFWFTRATIYTPLDSNAFQFWPDSALRVTSTYRDTAKGALTWEFDTLYRELRFNWHRADSTQTSLTIDGFYLDSDAPGIRYHGMGANGNSTESLVRCSHFFKQLPDLQTDLAIFGIGINDAYKPEEQFDAAQYEANYQQIIDSLRAANPNVALWFITNNDSYYDHAPNPTARKIVEIMTRLAEKNGGWVFDLFTYMGGMNASMVWYQHNLGKRDKIHFTPEGYRIQANMMYRAMEHDFFNYLYQQHESVD